MFWQIRSACSMRLSLTPVAGDQPDLSLVIADGHPLPADTAQDHSLQESWPFSRWAMPAVIAVQPASFPEEPAGCAGIGPR